MLTHVPTQHTATSTRISIQTQTVQQQVSHCPQLRVQESKERQHVHHTHKHTNTHEQLKQTKLDMRGNCDLTATLIATRKSHTAGKNKQCNHSHQLDKVHPILWECREDTLQFKSFPVCLQHILVPRYSFLSCDVIVKMLKIGSFWRHVLGGMPNFRRPDEIADNITNKCTLINTKSDCYELWGTFQQLTKVNSKR